MALDRRGLWCSSPGRRSSAMGGAGWKCANAKANQGGRLEYNGENYSCLCGIMPYIEHDRIEFQIGCGQSMMIARSARCRALRSHPPALSDVVPFAGDVAENALAPARQVSQFPDLAWRY